MSQGTSYALVVHILHTLVHSISKLKLSVVSHIVLCRNFRKLINSWILHSERATRYYNLDLIDWILNQLVHFPFSSLFLINSESSSAWFSSRERRTINEKDITFYLNYSLILVQSYLRLLNAAAICGKPIIKRRICT